jgi:DNA repair protein RecN (Recombination protein N)
MIKTLHISNYALIDNIDVEFDEGLNIITGETGAGKSMILGALGALMGARAELKVVRNPDKKTIIEAVFGDEGIERVNRQLLELDIDACDGECILRREMTSKGGSRAFINDTPVTLQQLQSISAELLYIHSQHQNLQISKPEYQLYLLDTLAGIDELMDRYTKAYDDYRKALREYVDTRDMVNRNHSEAEYLSFQLEQLDELNLKFGEQEELENERELLRNVSNIKMSLVTALNALGYENNPVSDSIGDAAREMSSLTDVFEDASDLASRLQSARLEIQDIVETISNLDAKINADPARLDYIEERLGEIYSLETKHHVDTDAQLIELRERLRTQLEAINNSDETLARLEEKARLEKKKAVLIAREISEKRRAAADIFVVSIKERAMPLGMENIRCEISLVQGKLSRTGIDTVEFLFAFNKNQPLMPVGKTASGGEISRVILAIKSIVAEHTNLPTIIFDEVDTGVSGDIANKMGRLMFDISERVQVVTITHLPAVAAFGKRHFKVYKQDDELMTHTYVKRLTPEDRVHELALMLSGSATDPSAIATAKSLLLAHNRSNKTEDNKDNISNGS